MIRRWLKSWLSRGVRQALRLLQAEIGTQIRHRASVRKAQRYLGRRELELNLGCGTNIKQGWINADVFSDDAELHLDLREPFPFADGSVARVYAEHLLEHLEYPEEVGSFLSETLRVLRPGGLLDVGVPDTEWPVTAYVSRDAAYFDFVHRRFHPAWCDTRMHNLNYHFRQAGEHKYAYDTETLANVLKQAGFEDIAPRDFDAALDSEDRRTGTIYFRARKGRDRAG